MKAWFVFRINGKNVGTWANNIEDAEQNIVSEYGDISFDFLGDRCGNVGPKIDEITYKGMSLQDVILSSGLLNEIQFLR